MRPSNANFDRLLEKENKVEVYVITIFETDGTTPFKRFINMQHKDFVADDILDPPRSLSQEIEPEEGTGRFSSLSFGLLDKDLVVTGILKDFGLRRRRVTLELGFKALDGADFLQVFLGFIEEVDSASNFVGYNFQCQGPEVFGNESLFQPKQSQLDGAITASTSTLILDDVTDFPDPAAFSSFSVFYIRIDNKEIASYSGKNVGLRQLTGVVRGLKDTDAIAHADNKKVDELVILKDGGINPLTCYLAILFSTGAGNLLQDDPGAGPTEYDILPAHWALGIDQSLVNISDIETKRDKEISALLYEFRLGQRESAQPFITNEFFKNIGAYPIVQGDGRVSVRFFTRPVPLGGLAEWNMTNVREVSAYRLNLSRTYNFLGWEFDWDPIDKDYEARTERIDPDSITKFQKQPIRVYRSKGMRTSLVASSFIENRSDIIFFRFATPPPTLKVNAHFNRLLSEAGDQVFFSHVTPRSTKTGKQGFNSATMEIVDIRVDWDIRKVEATLQFVSLTTNFALWGPTTLLDATSEFNNLGTSPLNFEKYGFWANPAGKIVGGTQPGKVWG